MANPRDLAEQAFALLQSALRDSETRASDLDEQLKRKRAPKNRLEEQLDVLTHRLESVEGERVRWEQQAGHLEEIAEAERAKVAQLKKKLEIAESGPEKLTKKEVNFWRAKAETFDTDTKEYKERLAAVRRELMERDTLIETLRQSPPEPAPSVEPDNTAAEDAAEELRRQVQQRDQWLADLRLELHDLRAQGAAEPEPPLEALAEIETLRHQIASFELALAEAHNARAAVQADLNRTQHELSERDRLVRENQATSERTRTALEEREHRLVQLSAELEHLRADSRQREEQYREGGQQRDEQIAALARDLDTLRAHAAQEHHDAVAAQAELERLTAATSLAEQRNAHLSTELGRIQTLLADREREHDDAANRAEAVQTSLAERDAALAQAQQQLGQRDTELERLKQELNERERLLTEHRQQLGERERELGDRQQQLRDLGQRLADREHKLAAVGGDLEHLKTTAAANGREVTSLRETLLGANREVDQLRNHKQRLEAELSDVLTRVDTSNQATAAKDQELAQLREQILALQSQRDATEQQLAALQNARDSAEHEIATLQSQRDTTEQQLTALQSQRDAAQEQIAGLEGELKEEREHAENLGELANERREHMTKLQEQLEEAEERYEEAKWRLGKALYFERLVNRRKGLVAKLLAALRAKMKANVALKAGLDGLRTYKAAAEMNQQKLLQRIEGIKTELHEAEEAIACHQDAAAAKEAATEEHGGSESRAAVLEERLNTQAELIQSLEADLKAARLVHKSDDDKHHEMAELLKELDAKNNVIQQLQADTDEQQRKLAKLRGSESETVRLKALTEKDRSEIDTLQREIDQLREALVRQGGGDGPAAGEDTAELHAKLKERENSVTRLMGTIKEHEATIKKLNESAESWKRKYQFLATDSPDAYKTAAEK